VSPLTDDGVAQRVARLRRVDGGFRWGIGTLRLEMRGLIGEWRMACRWESTK
jgi:hypothetical protein